MQQKAFHTFIMPDAITNIAPNTLFVGQKLFYLPEVPSTNEFAADLLVNSKPLEGTAIMTPNQTKGKGQRGNHWESAAGLNLTVSFILYPTFMAVQQQFLLTQMVSLAVTDFAAHYAPKGLKIKWPNDIYHENKKLAGILIENTLKGNTINASIIGIGININQTQYGEGAANATSLKLITNSDFAVNECFRTLCNCLEARYLQLKMGKINVLQQAYLQKLYHINELHDYQIYGNTVRGTITGVNNDGRLQLTTVEDEHLLLDLKEIQFIR